jgi:hypothetical protein
MNLLSIVSTACICLACAAQPQDNVQKQAPISTEEVQNKAILGHAFLAGMYADSYFPKFLVDKGKEILLGLCVQIEEQAPKDLPALYRLTHAATIQFNELGDEFFENDSEIETRARECISRDFKFIAETYGFDADIEELTAPREW